MTAKQIELVNKQVEKTLKAYDKAGTEEEKLSKLLQRMGYNYNASFTNEEIIFIPCDENGEDGNVLDEKYHLEDLERI